MLDSPTNSFATLNSVHTGTGLLYEGNLRHASAYGYGYVYGKSTIAIPETGKWVFEGYFLVTPTTSNYNSIGVTSNPYLAGLAFDSSGNYGINDAYSYGQSFIQNGTRQGSISLPIFTFIQVLVDRDNNQMTFVKNGVLQTGTGSTVTIPSSGLLFPVVGEYVTTQVINFGQDSSFGGEVTRQGNTDANGIGDFYYAPPAGYLALCTANLPDPVIDPAQDDVPEDYFNTVLWTGDGTTGRSITGVGFAPDFAWIKDRSTAYSHRLFDTIRGASKFLQSDNTNAEGTNTETLQSFDSDGFTVGQNASVNGSSESIVAWNWKADGAEVTNTDGSITSTVSANQKAGFSIVTWTNPATVNQTIGHGLGVKPDVIIRKYRSNVDGWPVYHKSLGQTNYLQLNLTNASSTDANVWPGTIDSTVFSTGQLAYFPSGWTSVAYCFAEVEGYSKFGSYTGNGSADGTFVYCGFRPAFLLVKNTTTQDWVIYDNTRDPDNAVGNYLLPNTSGAEGSYVNYDFLSNGFKLRDAGASLNIINHTYIFMAFAEMPFKYANAR
jgi:hypothetical protein